MTRQQGISTPSKTWLIAGALLLAVTLVLLYTARHELNALARRAIAGQGHWFVETPPPLRQTHHLFDLGLVDADGDGRMDIYTANHNYRQVLLLNSIQGHRDVMTAWGLDQNREFPGWEQSFAAPIATRPGVYVYWLGERLILETRAMPDSRRVSGSIRMFSKIDIGEQRNVSVSRSTQHLPDSPIAQNTLSFTFKGQGRLALQPLSRGVPSLIEIEPTLPTGQIHIGPQGISPATHRFSPFLRDRHGLAWADVNADGRLDVYISRGGVGGMLRNLPAVVRTRIRDELLLSEGAQGFRDAVAERGFEKKDCSGRHTEWVDFDGDGRLDLFVNCQDRGKSKGPFPKQLWRQLPDGGFQDVAMDVGLGLIGRELIDFVWMDVDADGDADLLTSEDQGFFLFRNHAGSFTAEFIFRPAFVRGDVEGLKSEVNDYWRFDGKLSVADYDADGDLDVFASSKRGNALLTNNAGRFRPIPPTAVGLPAHSLNAVWVDYDDDGRPDLHVVPDGIYRQTRPGRFEASGLLALPDNRYQAAIVHWYDRDNDGRRDVLWALKENPTFWRWWQRPFKEPAAAFSWQLSSHRNLGSSNHWLQIAVSGPPGNRQAIGAHVSVTIPEGTQVQVVGGSDSAFFSQGHYRLYFGLGKHSSATRIAVRWSDGHILELRNVTVDRLLKIEHPDLKPTTAMP